MITPEEENTVPDSPMNRGTVHYSMSYIHGLIERLDRFTTDDCMITVD